MSFKAGDKVVFVGKRVCPYFNYPEHNEPLTIKGPCFGWAGHYDIWEYPKTKRGCEQTFSKECLRPIDFTFGEETASRIEEQINTKELQEV